MRVLLLNQVFHPDVAATAQMAHDLARRLVAAGHEVHVVASRSIYGQKGGQLQRRETVDGIHVHRVGVSLFGKGSMLARLIDFALFYVLAGAKVLTVPRPDVTVAFTTPPLVATLGWLVRTVRGGRYVYWLMDMYPDVLIAHGALRPGSLTHRLLEAVSRWCLRKADRVVVLGRDMRELVESKGVPASRVEHISVWADETGVVPTEARGTAYRKAWGLGESLVVMYSGNLGLAHDQATLLGAMGQLQHEHVRWVFVGGGKTMDALRERVEAEGWTHVQFQPYQPRERLGELLGTADVHLITQATAMRGLIVPSKLYGIMAASRPAAFVGPGDAEVARVLHECDGGRVIAVGDADALAAFVREMAAEPDVREAMGRRARAAFDEHYSARVCCGQWVTLLESLVVSPRV